jgi:hypothetical protein
MSNISQEDLFAYFKSRNNRYKNPKGMELGLTAGNDFWTYFSLCNHDYGPLAISISTGEDDFIDFTKQFRIKSMDDIDELGYSNSWMRHLNGNAEISVTPFELEATINFRIIRRKTIIYSLDLHFYDEVYEQLTLAEDFERYISTNNNRLYLAGQNRYKMNRK